MNIKKNFIDFKKKINQSLNDKVPRKIVIDNAISVAAILAILFGGVTLFMIVGLKFTLLALLVGCLVAGVAGPGAFLALALGTGAFCAAIMTFGLPIAIFTVILVFAFLGYIAVSITSGKTKK